MIKSFKHKGLKRLYLKGDPSGIRPDWVDDCLDILAHLDVAETRKELHDLAGYNFHSLKGNKKGLYAMKVNKNFRIVFRFLKLEKNVELVDLDDYHEN